MKPNPTSGRVLQGAAARKAIADAARRTSSRQELQHRHKERFDRLSPNLGELDEEALARLTAANGDEALSLLAELANATDRQLRAKARRAAAMVSLRMAQHGSTPRRGIRRLAVGSDALSGDLDMDATLSRSGGMAPRSRADIVTRQWTSNERAICLLVDRSGSMTGKGLATAAIAAATVVAAAGDQSDCSVLAFAKDAVVLQEQGRRRDLAALLDDVLSLRGQGVTDVALALRAARRQLGLSRARERVVVLLSDAKATAGDDPFFALSGLDTVHVLGPSADPDAVAAGLALARRGHGRFRLCTGVVDVPSAINALLNG